jgi:asparagine synthase (glutamine-hydrolysing)
MCGINGTFGVSDPAVISAMNDAVQHRGPDDEGIYCDPTRLIALGHRRLSILDLTSAGHQPMASANGRYRLVFNGEIYNYRELRKELETNGFRFKSDSDTEVLLAAYAEWGSGCVARLRGMFAFAIHDQEAMDKGETALFLARDRLGIKPLYYAEQASRFVFSSELKGMLASGLISRKVDRQTVWHYLSLGSVPQPRTILADVRMLMPGHWIKISLDRKVEITRYWDIAVQSRASFPDLDNLDASEAAIQLRHILDDATRLHLLSDVPVGAFLSGGIDSTAVVGLMSIASGKPIETFSIGFVSTSANPDERQWSELAARKFESRHTHVVVTDAAITAQFDQIIQAIDQPSLDGTNSFLVSKLASSSVKVALSGLGGDELFAGYPHFRKFAEAEKWDRRLKRIGLTKSRWLLGRLPERLLPNRQLHLAQRGQRLETLRNLAGSNRKDIVNSALLDCSTAVPLAEIYRPWLKPEMDAIAETTYAEISGYLVNTLLRDSDAMSMAHSLEVRPLLLDHVVAEFAFALPSRLKLSQAENKPVLVNSLRDILPPEVINRKKMGFELPLGQWLAGGLRERALSAFSTQTAKDIFSTSYLQSTMASLSNGDHQSLATWGYFVLLEWLSVNRGEL